MNTKHPTHTKTEHAQQKQISFNCRSAHFQIKVVTSYKNQSITIKLACRHTKPIVCGLKCTLRGSERRRLEVKLILKSVLLLVFHQFIWCLSPQTTAEWKHILKALKNKVHVCVCKSWGQAQQEAMLSWKNKTFWHVRFCVQGPNRSMIWGPC